MLVRYYNLASSCTDIKCHKKAISLIRKTHKIFLRMKRPSCKRHEKRRVRTSHFARLRRRLKRCKVKSCRRRVFSRFRREIESRERALYHQLRDMAKAEVMENITACASLPSEKKDECIDKIHSWEVKRLIHLKASELNIDRRRELRLCEITANPSKCRITVQAEYVRDLQIISNQAAVLADKDVANALTNSSNTTANRSLTNGLIAISSSLILVIVVCFAAHIL